jgi:hypothetical protein
MLPVTVEPTVNHTLKLRHTLAWQTQGGSIQVSK